MITSLLILSLAILTAALFRDPTIRLLAGIAGLSSTLLLDKPPELWWCLGAIPITAGSFCCWLVLFGNSSEKSAKTKAND